MRLVLLSQRAMIRPQNFVLRLLLQLAMHQTRLWRPPIIDEHPVARRRCERPTAVCRRVEFGHLAAVRADARAIILERRTMRGCGVLAMMRVVDAAPAIFDIAHAALQGLS